MCNWYTYIVWPMEYDTSYIFSWWKNRLEIPKNEQRLLNGLCAIWFSQKPIICLFWKCHRPDYDVSFQTLYRAFSVWFFSLSLKWWLMSVTYVFILYPAIVIYFYTHYFTSFLYNTFSFYPTNVILVVYIILHHFT